LMETGHCRLDQQIPARRALLEDKKLVEARARLEQAQQAAEELRLKALTDRLRPQARGVEAGISRFVSADEREAAEIILEDFFRTTTGPKQAPLKATAAAETVTDGKPPQIEVTRETEAEEPAGPATDLIQIGLATGGIENIDQLGIK